MCLEDTILSENNQPIIFRQYVFPLTTLEMVHRGREFGGYLRLDKEKGNRKNVGVIIKRLWW